MQLPAGYSIREATAADLPVILHHRRHMFLDMRFPAGPDLEAAMTFAESYFIQGLAQGTCRAWLVVEEASAEVVAGGAVMLIPYPASPRNPRELRPVIGNVYTEPRCRRSGLARALMEVMLDWCRGQAFHAVYLHASKEGRPLYEALGFLPTNEMRHDLRGP